MEIFKYKYKNRNLRGDILVNEVNLSIGLICHHGSWDDWHDGDRVLESDGRLVQRTFEKGIPLTFFFSGVQLEEMARHRGDLHSALWFDLVSALRHGTINPRYGYTSPFLPELGILTYNHNPLVQPGLQDQREYLEGVLPDQIGRSQAVANHHYDRIPVTILGPDGLYSRAPAYKLKEHGLDTVVVSSEFLGNNRHAKGKLYWANGMRHLVRTNDIQPQDSRFQKAEHFVDAVQTYGYENDIAFVVVLCDIDEFNGMRRKNNGMSLHDGIARICCIADEAYRRGLKIINYNAAAHWNMDQADLTEIWPVWDEIHAMQNETGDLSWIDWNRNNTVSDVVLRIGQKFREGRDVRGAKEALYRAADSACRHTHFGGGLTGYFWDNVNNARRLL